MSDYNTGSNPQIQICGQKWKMIGASSQIDLNPRNIIYLKGMNSTDISHITISHTSDHTFDREYGSLLIRRNEIRVDGRGLLALPGSRGIFRCDNPRGKPHNACRIRHLLEITYTNGEIVAQQIHFKQLRNKKSPTTIKNHNQITTELRSEENNLIQDSVNQQKTTNAEHPDEGDQHTHHEKNEIEFGFPFLETSGLDESLWNDILTGHKRNNIQFDEECAKRTKLALIQTIGTCQKPNKSSNTRPSIHISQYLDSLIFELDDQTLNLSFKNTGKEQIFADAAALQFTPNRIFCNEGLEIGIDGCFIEVKEEVFLIMLLIQVGQQFVWKSFDQLVC